MQYYIPNSLFTQPNRNKKTAKSEKYNTETFGLALAPADVSGFQVCPHSSEGFRKSCLFTTGNGNYPSVVKGRINKTLFFINDRKLFMNKLENELIKAVVKTQLLGKKLAVRINVLSDLEYFWKSGFMKKFPKVQFYDYTKNYKRMIKFLNGELPKNYHLTFSLSEDNMSEALDILNRGGNVAVVFRGDMPKEWQGFPVITGDEHDMRYEDPKKHWIFLTAKGKAKADKTGFVKDFH